MAMVTTPGSGPLGPSGSTGSRAWAVLMIAAGIAAIVLPLLAGFGVLGLVSILFLVNGAAHVVHSLQARGLGTFSWHALIGVLYVGAGLYILMRPDVGLASLAFLMAALFLIEGGLLLGGYALARRWRGAGWMLANGALSAGLGVLVFMAWPENSGEVLGLVLGINLVFGGFSRLMHRAVAPSA